jgi:hypothetical protein
LNYQDKISCDHRVPRVLLAGQSVEMLLIPFELSGTTPTKGTFRSAPFAQSALPPVRPATLKEASSSTGKKSR